MKRYNLIGVLVAMAVLLASVGVYAQFAMTPNPIAPTVDGVYDLGTSGFRFRALWLNGPAGSGGFRLTQTTAPTCTGTCGTSPSVAGSDTAMLVTLGTSTSGTQFVVTFNGTWAAAPACVVQRRTGTAGNVVQTVTSTTTTLTVNVATALVDSSVFSAICLPVS